MEFAEGNFGMIQGALEYHNDVTAPETTIEYSSAQTGREPINFKFNWVNEPSVIYYTTDGSTPVKVRLQRAPGGVAASATTTRARAVRARCSDLSPRRPQRQVVLRGHQGQPRGQDPAPAGRGRSTETGTPGGTVPATLSLTLGTPAASAPFTPGVAAGLHGGDDGQRDLDGGRRELSVADPSSTNTGHLINGTFSLPQMLQANASSLGGTGGGVRPGGRLGQPDVAADLQRPE